MRLERRDIVFVHDLSPDDGFLPEDWTTLFGVAEKGAFPALTRMREDGLIDGWAPIPRCLEVADSDVYLLVSQYSRRLRPAAARSPAPARRRACPSPTRA